MKRLRLRLAPLIALLALPGCGHSPPTVLHSLEVAPPARERAAYSGLPVTVDVVRLPPEIDRIEMLRPSGTGRYVVLETDRWAASPARLALQTMIQDLTLRLPTGAVLTNPSAGETSVSLSIAILTFSLSTEHTSLSAEWSISCGSDAVPRRRSAQLESGATIEMAASLTVMLGQLADNIADDLERDPPVCKPRHN